MSNTPHTLSAFSEIDFESIVCDPQDLKISELETKSHFNLRGQADNQKFLTAVKQEFSIELPLKANTFASSGERSALWLGPNEWLIIAEPSLGVSSIDHLRSALSGEFASVHEISGGNALLSIKGSKAAQLICKGCPIDLHAREFNIGDCAQSLIAKSPITLWKVDDSPEFHLLVRRSFANYLGLWLIDAAREYLIT